MLDFEKFSKEFEGMNKEEIKEYVRENRDYPKIKLEEYEKLPPSSAITLFNEVGRKFKIETVIPERDNLAGYIELVIIEDDNRTNEQICKTPNVKIELKACWIT